MIVFPLIFNPLKVPVLHPVKMSQKITLPATTYHQKGTKLQNFTQISTFTLVLLFLSHSYCR